MKTINDQNKKIFLENSKKFHDLKVPIYKGCRNKECFCTGDCNEIIGYRDRDILDELDRLPSKKQGGFFDLPKRNQCNDPSHNPPSHMVIPQGKGYRHICPSCGKETVIIPQQISL